MTVFMFTRFVSTFITSPNSWNQTTNNMVFETIEDHKTKPTPSHHFEIKPKIRIKYVFYYFCHDKTYDKNK